MSKTSNQLGAFITNAALPPSSKILVDLDRIIWRYTILIPDKFTRIWDGSKQADGSPDSYIQALLYGNLLLGLFNEDLSVWSRYSPDSSLKKMLTCQNNLLIWKKKLFIRMCQLFIHVKGVLSYVSSVMSLKQEKS